MYQSAIADGLQVDCTMYPISLIAASNDRLGGSIVHAILAHYSLDVNQLFDP
jgi:hypothetical protein